MNRSNAETEIKNIFNLYRSALPTDKKLLSALSSGKLYELFVLSYVITNLSNRGFRIVFIGKELKFKGAPGMVKLTDAHFQLWDPGTNSIDWRVFVDIEFQTLGGQNKSTIDASNKHEIDIVVTKALNGYPDYDTIALAVECKSTPKFKKNLLKEALGIRRELCYFTKKLRSPLAPSGGSAPLVNACPPSEYWLANVDAKIAAYQQSPATFSIEMLCLKP